MYTCIDANAKEIKEIILGACRLVEPCKPFKLSENVGLFFFCFSLLKKSQENGALIPLLAPGARNPQYATEHNHIESVKETL